MCSDYDTDDRDVRMRSPNPMRLMSDALMSDALMIACVSPASSNYKETLDTLRFAAVPGKLRTIQS
ncbi:hypothetical protein DAPPUDRAFT_249713 [Daphnia pulex]|uniref:Kinesin motor domain-containing protein n=1 Tax=Daphnia pulex TaxID=6669 RepID=E9GX56_DAPPU|nr:hypothetical protein DAPPUDRAFT_249713 [Daphnia pulex]|eukprot:EFX75815.1 hypothetical protein DAPPUDRAFT_249713 [Daphnia pulex]